MRKRYLWGIVSAAAVMSLCTVTCLTPVLADDFADEIVELDGTEFGEGDFEGGLEEITIPGADEGEIIDDGGEWEGFGDYEDEPSEGLSGDLEAGLDLPDEETAEAPAETQETGGVTGENNLPTLQPAPSAGTPVYQVPAQAAVPAQGTAGLAVQESAHSDILFDANGGQFANGLDRNTITGSSWKVAQGVFHTPNYDDDGNPVTDSAGEELREGEYPFVSDDMFEGFEARYASIRAKVDPDDSQGVQILTDDGEVFDSADCADGIWYGVIGAVPFASVSGEERSGDGFSIEWKVVYSSADGAGSYLEPSRDGYLFDGWYTDEDASVLWDGTPTDTVYAGWLEDEDAPEDDPEDVWEDETEDEEDMTDSFADSFAEEVEDGDMEVLEEGEELPILRDGFEDEDEWSVVGNSDLIETENDETDDGTEDSGAPADGKAKAFAATDSADDGGMTAADFADGLPEDDETEIPEVIDAGDIGDTGDAGTDEGTFGDYADIDNAGSADNPGTEDPGVPGDSTSVAYTVKHLLMDADGVNYTLKDVEHLTAAPGTQVTPVVKSYEGFTSPNTQTVQIGADGATVVEYRYARKLFNYTLNQVTGADLSGSTPSGTRYYGEEITLKCVATSGYEFVEWSNGDTSSITSFTMPASDVTITPTVRTASYVITYDLDGGTANNPEAYSSTTESFTLNVPVKDGYTFAGWTGANGDTPQVTVTINKGTSGNLTFKANWTQSGSGAVLTPTPAQGGTLGNVQTGDMQKPILFACIGGGALVVILLLLFFRRKKK